MVIILFLCQLITYAAVGSNIQNMICYVGLVMEPYRLQGGSSLFFLQSSIALHLHLPSRATTNTTLRSDIYRALLKAFDAATSGIPRAPACVTSTCSSTAAGHGSFPVAALWWCQRAILFGGGFQMEDRLLLFNLDKETFGFSGPLAGFRTGCHNFNFTMTPPS
ncbi:hypothetical protein PR202_gb03821 [Eleusine coracana subsp. coracana]|uniref:Uncharacterized protein n=1 Tax=Eleusine coracana subsp. coracana TaxID=191504 RepID=A0AAV5E2W7_ELECO|nr:hypothetical protein PR202_gb03821 [Eleusine coracana subsp. coracana]